MTKEEALEDCVVHSCPYLNHDVEWVRESAIKLISSVVRVAQSAVLVQSSYVPHLRQYLDESGLLMLGTYDDPSRLLRALLTPTSKRSNISEQREHRIPIHAVNLPSSVHSHAVYVPAQSSSFRTSLIDAF